MNACSYRHNFTISHDCATAATSTSVSSLAQQCNRQLDSLQILSRRTFVVQALNDFIDRKLQASPIKSLIVYPEGNQLSHDIVFVQ